MEKKPRKYCIVCEQKICRSKGQTKLKTRRGPSAVTCSKKCSKIYTRISKYIRDSVK